MFSSLCQYTLFQLHDDKHGESLQTAYTEAEAAHQRGSLLLLSFSRTSYISQKHVSNSRGSASAMQPVKIFQRKFPPGLPFSQLSPCPGCDFCLRSPKHSSRAGQVFMINPKFLFKYLKMAWKHWLRCSGLRNLQCKEVKKQLPLAVYPAPLQSTPSLELLVKVC